MKNKMKMKPRYLIEPVKPKKGYTKGVVKTLEKGLINIKEKKGGK